MQKIIDKYENSSNDALSNTNDNNVYLKIEYISFRRKRLREIIRYVFKEELKELCQKVKFPYQSF